MYDQEHRHIVDKLKAAHTYLYTAGASLHAHTTGHLSKELTDDLREARHKISDVLVTFDEECQHH